MRAGKDFQQRFSLVVDRMIEVSQDLVRLHPNPGDPLLRFCTDNIKSQDDYELIAKCMLPGSLCDNMFLEAGIACITPLPAVVFMSSSFHYCLSRSATRYVASAGMKICFTYDEEPYRLLLKATESFEFLPTIIIPVNFDMHWGYIIVIPHAREGKATIMWGDSLRYAPSEGLLETLRCYLVLFYRDVQFSVSTRNHTLDDLKFSRQLDGYSCGFYVLAAMASYGSGFTDPRFRSLRFFRYDPAVTEAYRDLCTRSIVQHIFCEMSRGKEHITLVEMMTSLTSDRDILQKNSNANKIMYDDVDSSIRSKMRRETCFECVEDVLNVDEENIFSPESGLVSRFMSTLLPRPLVTTNIIRMGVQHACYSDVVNVDKIGDDVDEQDVVGVFNSCKNVGTRLPKVEDICNSEDVSVGDMDSTLANDTPEQRAMAINDTEYKYSPSGLGSFIDQVQLDPDGAITEEQCHNLFSYLAVRLREGHLLRKPEYKIYKEGEFMIRLRLRCRLYEPPPRWKKGNVEYQKCQVRLYARLLRNGEGWRLSFRHRHNHKIWLGARLGPDEIRLKLTLLRNSLRTRYVESDTEHGKWLRGEPFIGGNCPAVDGEWDSIKEVCKEERGSVNLSQSEDDCDATTQEVCYTLIAPGPPPTDQKVGLSVPTEIPDFRDGVGKIGVEEVEKLIPLSIEVHDSLRKYVQSCDVAINGKAVKDEIKHLSECFGFPLRVRDSSYYYDWKNPPGDQGTPQVQRLAFECVVGSDTKLKEKCNYSFMVVSTLREYVRSGEDAGASNESVGSEFVSRPLLIKFCENWHNHASNSESVRKSLPLAVWKEAVHMKDRTLLSTASIVRHVEEKYNIALDRKVLARRLRWEMSKRHPVERECQQLVSNLFKFTTIHPGMYCEARVVDENTLHSVCWGFPDWREEYVRFGVVPGITIDAKAIANNYDTPLVIICGRTNNGSVTIFFMGFLASQRGEEFLWIMKQFRKFVEIPPRLVACDQDSAIINSVEKVFPTSKVILDDWHLNKNQLKNTKAYTTQNGRGNDAMLMSKSLYRLRQSRTEAEFIHRREAFEAEFISDTVLPVWYRTLYYTYSKFIVLCFNRTTCGERFLFQGSGYAEAANSQYRRLIMDRKLTISRVPEEFKRYMERRVQERTGELKMMKFSGRMAEVSTSQLGFDSESWSRIANLYVPFAWEHIIENSLRLAHRYTVCKFESIETGHETYGGAYAFTVVGDGSNGYSYRVVVPISWSHGDYIFGVCTCNWSRSSGLLCRHAARVATVFREYTSDRSRFPVECMMHPYWRKDGEGWGRDDVIKSRLKTSINTITETGEDEVLAPDMEEYASRERMDHVRTVLWCNGHSVWNQMHQRVSRKGVEAMRKLDTFMSLLLQQVVTSNEKDGLDIAGIARRLSNAVELCTGVRGSEPRELNLTESKGPLAVKNINQGSVKGRGTKKRARSWTEKRSTKKKAGGRGKRGKKAPALS